MTPPDHVGMTAEGCSALTYQPERKTNVRPVRLLAGGAIAAALLLAAACGTPNHPTASQAGTPTAIAAPRPAQPVTASQVIAAALRELPGASTVGDPADEFTWDGGQFPGDTDGIVIVGPEAVHLYAQAGDLVTNATGTVGIKVVGQQDEQTADMAAAAQVLKKF